MKKKRFIVLSILLVFFIGVFANVKTVNADELSDSIGEQLENIDLSELEDFGNGLNVEGMSNIISFIGDLLEGKYNLDYSTVLEYVKNIVMENIYKILPIFSTVAAIGIFCGILNNMKGSFLSEGIADIIFFVAFLSIIIILIPSVFELYNSTKNIIENIANLCEIMSPIILSLMVAAGGTVSASVYKPAVIFLSSAIIDIYLYVILPLIGIVVLFDVMANFSPSLKLKKFSDCALSVVKWVSGISFTVFGVFLSVQGITSGTFDGISIKAAKYAISNSIPLIGGFLSSGFDLIVAGSILIKNAVGVAVIFLLFYTILSPVLYLMTYSLMLKCVGAILEPISDTRISDLCTNLSKTVNYFLTSLLAVGFMLFITVLLMIFSANAFI